MGVDSTSPVLFVPTALTMALMIATFGKLLVAPQGHDSLFVASVPVMTAWLACIPAVARWSFSTEAFAAVAAADLTAMDLPQWYLPGLLLFIIGVAYALLGFLALHFSHGMARLAFRAIRYALDRIWLHLHPGLRIKKVL
jgi:hypothetical protein